jgi:hypothetical protein
LICGQKRCYLMLGSLADGPVMSRIAFAIVLVLVLGAPVMAQTCNPAIDGTYCATQPIRKPSVSTVPNSKFMPIQSLARDISPGQDQPGTFGAITFRGSERCIGLLRRGACN